MVDQALSTGDFTTIAKAAKRNEMKDRQILCWDSVSKELVGPLAVSLGGSQWIYLTVFSLFLSVSFSLSPFLCLLLPSYPSFNKVLFDDEKDTSNVFLWM